MKTPTLDKHRLHPFGGYAKNYAHGEFERLAAEQKARWEALTPKQAKKAQEEFDNAYPRTSNQDGGR